MAQLPNPNADSDGLNTPTTESGGLVQYCMNLVEHGRRVRDQKYSARWREYTRLWRGFWSGEDKNTESERSKLIAPALQQAVEMTVAEMEEAVFGRSAWFDITDDIADENKDDAVVYRDQLLEDFDLDGVPDAVSRAMLLGAVYGTGILKINVMRKTERTFVDGKEVSRPRVAVTGECVRPDEFVIDPAALNIDEALFCAHEMIRPLHVIRERQKAGTYRAGDISAYTGRRPDTDGTGVQSTVQTADNGVMVTEFFGKVPARMIPGAEGEGLVEAIVTIANERTLLRAQVSPYTMKDRPIIAYQHDTVPGEFWGRGVCEKGYNPQKALDAELRARIDALALLTAPMMGADLTKIPTRNPDGKVKPGRMLFTRGRPSEVYEQIAVGNPAMLAHTFQHTGDLERMVQMGTGAMDSATPVGVNSRNETASGMSQMQSGFIKRSKRTMQNLERQFLDPLIRRALWRYMQFDPQRYPVDFKFTVNATMGIMAREVENSQLTNMLGFLTPDDPARKIVIQAIFDNSASANKKELKEAVAAMNRPPDPEQLKLQRQMQDIQLQLAKAQADAATAEAERLRMEVELLRAKTSLTQEQARHERIEADLEDDLVDIQAANAVTAAEKSRAANRQTVVAEQRNYIEARKLQKGGSE